MTRHVTSWVLVILLLMVSATDSTADGDGDAGPPGHEMIGGAPWSSDIRVTYNRAEDRMPQVVVDASQQAHVIWQRNGYWTKTLDREGRALTTDVFITPHVVRGLGDPSRYPLGPQVAIDGDGCIHVVWDDGWQDCYYRKFDADGNVMTAEVHLGNVDDTASHGPSVAVDPVNDHVHVVHEDYEYGCMDIVYDKLDNDGKVLVNEVSVSNDVSSHCEHCTLTTDRMGYIHVAFGSSSGAWWRKVDPNGVARGRSVSTPSVPAYMVTDVACTPDGDVHLVWTAGGEVRYTRLDNNGTRLDGDVVVSDGGFHPGPPRIAAAHEENAVYIVWHARRDGNAEIYLARMEEGGYDRTPENLRLTDDPATSLYPRVAVGPEDSVHVVWTDERDGNSEVYYKYMFHGGMHVGMLDHPRLPFFHPRETKTTHYYLENRGMLPDDYTVTASYDEWAEQEGWTFHLNETEFHDVQPGSSVRFHLSITSPAIARDGDRVNVTLTAASSLSGSERFEWRCFVIVERAVSLECGETTRAVTSGGDVRFDLTVANTGDVPDSFVVEHALVPEDAGWRVEADVEVVTLDVDASLKVSVLLSAPGTAGANERGTVLLRVTSMTDASVFDSLRLTAVVDPDLLFLMEAPEPIKWVDPGSSVEFAIRIRNAGNMPGDATVLVSSTRPRSDWGAYLSNATVFLASGEERVIKLTVTAPANALAEYRHTVEVSAVSEDLLERSSVEVMVGVKQVHQLYPCIQDFLLPVHGGETGRGLLYIYNEGNGIEHVTLDSDTVPAGWDISFEHQGVAIDGLTMLSKNSRTVVVVASTSPDSRAGRHSFRVLATDSAGTRYEARMNLEIIARHAVDLSSPDPLDAAVPGGTATYRLVLLNGGNGEDTLALGLDGLPGTGWAATFHDADGTPVGKVTLAAGERRDVELRVRVPGDPDLDGLLDLLARATSTNAEVDEVKLTLDVRLADLEVLSVEYDPGTSAALRPTLVTIGLANLGSAPARNASVVMLEDGRELGRELVEHLPEGYVVKVTFQWTPSPGRHTLTYRVSGDTLEAELGNNELVHVRTVEGDPSAPVDLFLGVALMALACVAVAAWVRPKWNLG